MKCLVSLITLLFLLGSCQPDPSLRYLPPGLTLRQFTALIEGNVLPLAPAVLSKPGSMKVVFADYRLGELTGQQEWLVTWSAGEFEAACLVLGQSDDGPRHLRVRFQGFVPPKPSEPDVTSSRGDARSFPLDFPVMATTSVGGTYLSTELQGGPGKSFVVATYASNAPELGQEEAGGWINTDAVSYFSSETFRKLERVVVVTAQLAP